MELLFRKDHPKQATADRIAKGIKRVSVRTSWVWLSMEGVLGQGQAGGFEGDWEGGTPSSRQQTALPRASSG
jgi:hypothetical protein